jgi:hypothetical protein
LITTRGDDGARYAGPRRQDQRFATDLAFDLSVDLDQSFGGDIADDLEPAPDHRSTPPPAEHLASFVDA